MNYDYTYGKVGSQPAVDGAIQPIRLDKTGALVTSLSHGKYFEQASRGKLFYAANTGAVTTSVGLTATYTGLCVSNPAGNTYNLVPLLGSWAFSVAPAAISSVHLIGGYTAAGIVTHTTPLTNPPACTLLNNVLATAKADAAATIVAPLYLQSWMSGFTATALPSTSPSIIDLDGAFVIPPGGWFAIGTLTASAGFGGFIWEEVPI